MKVIRLFISMVARFLISLVFLAGAVNKIIHWREVECSVMNTLCDWQFNVNFSESLQELVGWLASYMPLLLVIATLLEFFGALSVLLGIKEKFGAFLLILFLVPTTILMHQFWFVEGVARDT